jgi:hypothetical protein
VLGTLLLVLATACAEDEGLKVKSLSRTSGAPGEFITIVGSGFQSGGARDARIYFGNEKVHTAQIKGDDKILVKVPGGIEMGTTVDIKLIFEPGGDITYPNAFKYVLPVRQDVGDLVEGKN